MSHYADWFRSHAHELTGSGLWLSGAEPNRLPPSAWEIRDFRVLVARLSTWQDTLESFTHRVLYAMLREMEGVYPDLSWVPPHHDGQILTEAGVPWLLGSGSHRGVEDFDVLALSNALVQETINVPVLLERSGIPVSRRERAGREDLPLVVLGGANSLYASALFGEDSPVDLVFAGEEPVHIQDLFRRLQQAKAEHLSRADRILAALEVPGAYLPDTWTPKTRKKHSSKPDLNRYKLAEPIPAAEGVAGTASLQISEGCPYFCSFCAESWSRKPYREVGLEQAREEALLMKRELGLSHLDLYSFNFNTYEHIRPLVAGLLEDFSGVGLKSQRFDALAHDPTFVKLLQTAGKTSITCGLEGISTRMRKYLQKDLTDEELDRSLDSLLRARLRELKVFVIVTGNEEQEDYDDWKAFLYRLKDKLRRSPHPPRTVVSATPLVRFPWTPLEFEDMPDPKTLSRMCGLVKATAVSAGFEFRGAADVDEAWVSQVLVRARGPEILSAVREAQSRTGYVFRDVITTEFFETLRAVFTERGIDPDSTVQGYHPEVQPTTPWDDLNPGVTRKFLRSEWQRCRDFLQTPVCLGWVEEEGDCHACGACTKTEKEAITHARQAPRQDLDALDKKIREIRRSETLVPIEVDLAATCRGLPRDLVEAWHARAWMQAFPELTRGYRRHESDPEDAFLSTGRRILTSVWLPEAAERVREILADDTLRSALDPFFAPYGTIQGAQGEPPRRFVMRSTASLDPSKWLVERGLKHTFRREGTARRWEFPKETLKKRILKDLVREEQDGTMVLRVETDEKFDVREFLRAVVPDKERHLLEASWS